MGGDPAGAVGDEFDAGLEGVAEGLGGPVGGGGGEGVVVEVAEVVERDEEVERAGAEGGGDVGGGADEAAEDGVGEIGVERSGVAGGAREGGGDEGKVEGEGDTASFVVRDDAGACLEVVAKVKEGGEGGFGAVIGKMAVVGAAGGDGGGVADEGEGVCVNLL